MAGIMKKLFLVLITLSFVTTQTKAQTIEMDLKSALQIAENTAVASGLESIIEDTLKTSRRRNDSIAAMASTITILRTVYHNARRNVTGFGRESAIYKKIYNKVLALVPKMGAAVSLVLKDPIHGVSSLENIIKIKNRLEGLSKQYSQIVANGHVDNPMKHDDRESDGYNFLSSRDRYMMASAILTELNAIDWQLTIIMYATHQKSAKMNLLTFVDYKTYCTAWETKRTANMIIDKINRLKKEADDL